MIVSPRLSKGQSVYLDFVRAAAAMSVLFGHAAAMFLQNSFFQQLSLQVSAVPVFFLLSGFLISLSVFQKHANQCYGFTEYFIDRFCRIYSAFVPALFFALIVDWLIIDTTAHDWRNQFNAQSWFGNLLMLQDFPLFQIARRLGIHDNAWFVGSFGTAKPFWTISIEWWIYMLFGFLYYFHVRTEKPFRLAQWIILAFLAIEPAYHFIGGPDRCLTMLWIIGMGTSLLFLRLPALAADWTTDEHRWRRTCFIVSIFAVLAIGAHGLANKYHEQNTSVYHQVDAGITEFQSGVYLAIALFSLLFAFATIDRVPKLLVKTVRFLADYSYSLYLTHSTVLVFIEAHASNTQYNPSLFWLGVLLSNGIAVLFWWFFERHHQALADRLKLLAARRKPQSVSQTV